MLLENLKLIGLKGQAIRSYPSRLGPSLLADSLVCRGRDARFPEPPGSRGRGATQCGLPRDSR